MRRAVRRERLLVEARDLLARVAVVEIIRHAEFERRSNGAPSRIEPEYRQRIVEIVQLTRKLEGEVGLTKVEALTPWMRAILNGTHRI